MQPDELEFWIDFNLPPVMARWLEEEFNLNARSFFELGFEFSSDIEVFKKAKEKSEIVVITTKDIDFIFLEKQIGAPPKILYINTGNITNTELHLLISKSFNEVLKIFTRTNQTVLELTNQL